MALRPSSWKTQAWGQSVLLLAALLAVILLGLGLQTAFLTDLLRRNLTDTARLLLSLDLVEALDKDPGRLYAVFQSQPDYRITLMDTKARVLADSHWDGVSPLPASQELFAPEVVDALNRGFGTSTRVSRMLAREMLYVALRIEGSGGARGLLRVAAFTNGLSEAQLQYLLVSALVALVLWGLALWPAWMRAHQAGLSLTAVQEALKAYRRGGPRRLLELGGAREWAQLGVSLNTLFAALDERFKHQQAETDEAARVLESLTEGVLVLDRGLRLRNLNQAARLMLRVTEDNPRGRSLLELGRSTALADFAAACLDERPGREPRLYVALEGGLQVQVQGSPLPGEGGTDLVLVLTDVTVLRRLEQVRKDFVANVSHELKTPITNILGYVETLQAAAGDDPERRRHFLGVIERSTRRLNDLIDDLLTLSKLERDDKPRKQACDLVMVARTALQLCEPRARSKNQRLTLEAPESLVTEGYPSLLEQMLVNLIDNALKYSPAETAVLVEVAAADPGLRLAVTDQGPGLPEKELGRIFERFYRVDKGRSSDTGGTGLGLSIVKHVALVHGGQVQAFSRLGAGCRFEVTLPVSQASVESGSPSRPQTWAISEAGAGAGPK